MILFISNINSQFFTDNLAPLTDLFNNITNI